MARTARIPNVGPQAGAAPFGPRDGGHDGILALGAQSNAIAHGFV